MRERGVHLTDNNPKHDHDHDHAHENEHGCCEHGHDCCGHDHEQEFEWIELQDEEGKTHKFVLDTFFELDEKQYALLIAEDQMEAEEPELSVLRVEQDEDGNDVLADLEEDEFERVRAAIEDGSANVIDFFDDEDIETEEE